MKHMQADKYNIAWFRLAECISRREKERALGVYRLLSHSFENQAVVYQLEGDIMLAFNDRDSALDKYIRAARLYEQQGEIMQAIAVYDHIIMLAYSLETVKKMIDLYGRCGDHQRMFAYIKHACHYLHKQQEIEQLCVLIDISTLSHAEKAVILVELTLKTLCGHAVEQQILQRLIEKTVKLLVYDHSSLQQFLSKLKAIDERAYTYAYTCMQD